MPILYTTSQVVQQPHEANHMNFSTCTTTATIITLSTPSRCCISFSFVQIQINLKFFFKKWFFGFLFWVKFSNFFLKHLGLVPVHAHQDVLCFAAERLRAAQSSGTIKGARGLATG
jgi:hypothetical protein